MQIDPLQVALNLLAVTPTPGSSDQLSVTTDATGPVNPGQQAVYQLDVATQQLGFFAGEFTIGVDDTGGFGVSSDPDLGVIVAARIGHSIADFDLDGDTDVDDIDGLTSRIGGPAAAHLGDLDRDGDIDADDRAAVVQNVLNTAFGDLDLDGKVDGIDFNAFAQGFGTGDSYGQGDLNGDGSVDGLDFNSFAQNFGFDNTAASAVFAVAVPEPASLGVLSLTGWGLLRRRR